MQIELFGCTSAGKSTLANSILEVCREQGMDALMIMSDDFVLKQARLDWIKTSFARTLLMDLFLLFVCLATWQSNLEFSAFAIQIIFRLPITWLEKLNLARNVLKRIGTFEIIHNRGPEQQIVLVDGGTLQAAHHLFVHTFVQTNDSDLSTFVRLAPLPTMAIYITQNESVLVKRTIKRGHKRIPDRSDEKVKIFIKQAVNTFDKLVQQLVLEAKLSVVDSQRNVFVAQGYQSDPLLAKALEIIRAEIDAAIVNNSTQNCA